MYLNNRFSKLLVVVCFSCFGCSTSKNAVLICYREKGSLTQVDINLIKHMERTRLKCVDLSCVGLSAALAGVNIHIQNEIGGRDRISYIINDNRLKEERTWDQSEYNLKLQDATLNQIVDKLAIIAKMKWKVDGSVVFFYE